jgi:hypothetical protein
LICGAPRKAKTQKLYHREHREKRRNTKHRKTEKDKTAEGSSLAILR